MRNTIALVAVFMLCAENALAQNTETPAGAMEIGAAWKRQTATQREYLSVKLDDPSLPAPVNARLIAADDDNMNLYWSRRNAE